MPITFKCVLQCDAEGCHSNQEAVAVYKPNPAAGLFGGLLAGEGDFEFRYDKASGLEWRVLHAGKAYCSVACTPKPPEPKPAESAAPKKEG